MTLESTVVFAGFRQCFFIQSPNDFVMVISLINIIRRKTVRQTADGDAMSACRKNVSCNISKTSARVSSGFQTRETFAASWFYCFRAFGNLMKPEARLLEITSPTKKISLNYHLNVDDLHNDILESTVIFVGFRQCFFTQSPNLFVMVVSLIDIISV